MELLSDGTDVVSECAGCKNAEWNRKCMRYTNPRAKWRVLGGCPSATNRATVVTEAKKLNPLKAAKREMKGKAAASK